jgi:ketosteroid isomerase-like protein
MINKPKELAVFSRKRVMMLLAVGLSMAPAFAQPAGRERTADAVMSVEHQWLAALDQHDVATLARILAREFIDSDFQGDAITRAQYLGYFAHPVPKTAPRLQKTFEDTKVRFVAGGDVAIVTGVVVASPAVASKASSAVVRPAAASKGASPARAPASDPDRGKILYSRFTDVFVWRDGRWQAVTGQETHFTRRAG